MKITYSKRTIYNKMNEELNDILKKKYPAVETQTNIPSKERKTIEVKGVFKEFEGMYCESPSRYYSLISIIVDEKRIDSIFINNNRLFKKKDTNNEKYVWPKHWDYLHTIHIAKINYTDKFITLYQSKYLEDIKDWADRNGFKEIEIDET